MNTKYLIMCQIAFIEDTDERLQICNIEKRHKLICFVNLKGFMYISIGQIMSKQVYLILIDGD